jgi:hypothetical protein
MTTEPDNAYSEADQGSFANLVLAQRSADAVADHDATRQAFIKRYGPIIYSRFGKNIACGVALTDTKAVADRNLADLAKPENTDIQQREAILRRILHWITGNSTTTPRWEKRQRKRERKWWLTQQAKPVRLHLVLPTPATAQVLTSLSRCGEQAVYARRFLQDEDLRQCLTLLYWPADALIALADADAPGTTPEKPVGNTTNSSQLTRPAPMQATAGNGSGTDQLAAVDEQLITADQYYQHITQRSIRAAYFQGIGIGILLVVGLVVLYYLLHRHLHAPVSYLLWSIIAGGLGALTSVLASATSGNIVLDRAAGSNWNRSLGAFRPIIGGLFGAAFFALINAGFLPVKIPSTNAIALYASIAFLAGFSQRWAQDTFKAAEGKISAPSTPGSRAEQKPTAKSS